jgi:predicted SAM-dependent methyltransferase
MRRTNTKDAIIREKSIFLWFLWSLGCRLDFTDNSFSFIYNEHFLEHIWQDEANLLFRECFRVLMPSGVFRIVVPDADLRVYEDPEPIAFDAQTNLPSTRGWQHPEVHKTRWNVYLLSLLLTQAGFQVRPIVFCTKAAEFVQEWPQEGDPQYPQDADWDVIRESTYINRKDNSLIVDAIKLV